MNCRLIACSLTAVALLTLAPAGAAAQTGDAAPRTAWGAPDLQGVWDFRSLTPMERPEELAGDERFSPEQAAEFAAETIRSRSRDAAWCPTTTSGSTEGDGGDDRAHLADRRSARRPHSAADRGGPTAPGGACGGAQRGVQPRADARRLRRGPRSRRAAGALHPRLQLRPADGPERLQQQPAGVPDRGHRRPLRRDGTTRPRVVPLDGRAHLTDSVRQWTGNSRGRWDGRHPGGRDQELPPRDEFPGAAPPPPT